MTNSTPSNQTCWSCCHRKSSIYSLLTFFKLWQIFDSSYLWHRRSSYIRVAKLIWCLRLLEQVHHQYLNPRSCTCGTPTIVYEAQWFGSQLSPLSIIAIIAHCRANPRGTLLVRCLCRIPMNLQAVESWTFQRHKMAEVTPTCCNIWDQLNSCQLWLCPEQIVDIQHHSVLAWHIVESFQHWESCLNLWQQPYGTQTKAGMSSKPCKVMQL